MDKAWEKDKENSKLVLGGLVKEKGFSFIICKGGTSKEGFCLQQFNRE
jgi:hypothetical protein